MIAALLILLLIGAIDWQCRRIPNELALMLFVVALLALRLNWPIASIIVNVVIGLLLSLPGYLKGTLGGGDVKLLLALSPLLDPMMYLASFACGILILLLILQTHGFYLRHIDKKSAAEQEAHTDARKLTRSIPTEERGLPVGTALFFGVLTVNAWELFLAS